MLVAASLCRNGAGEAALPAVPPSRPAAALLDAEEIEQIYSNLGDRGFIGTGEREGGGGDDLHGKSRALVHGDAADRQSPSTGNTVDSIADNDEFLLCSLGRALWTGVRLPLEMAATASRRILALQRALAAKCAPPVDRTLIMGRVSSGETSLGGSDALCVDDEAIARELQAQEDEEARAQVAAQEHHRLALAAAFAGTAGPDEDSSNGSAGVCLRVPDSIWGQGKQPLQKHSRRARMLRKLCRLHMVGGVRVLRKSRRL